ncbi:hypothetical protein FACS1894164_05080 [Spirochaetia bacterium]|nr:hypothetical protein FACS1894164_05080 [Spirochaetia bacterium]
MVFIWNNDWATGHPLIDEQHKQLFAAINAFLDTGTQGASTDRMLETLNFLNDYTIKHFFDEEQLQKKFQYPDYPRHREIHEALKANVRALMSIFIRHGTSLQLTSRVKTEVGDWLVAHIKSEDQRVAAHIRSKELVH